MKRRLNGFVTFVGRAPLANMHRAVKFPKEERIVWQYDSRRETEILDGRDGVDDDQ